MNDQMMKELALKKAEEDTVRANQMVEQNLCSPPKHKNQMLKMDTKPICAKNIKK